MGFWSEFVKSFKEQTENSKELNESVEELKRMRVSESLKKTREAFEIMKGRSREGFGQLREGMGGAAAQLSNKVSALSPRLRSKMDSLNQGIVGDTLERTKEGLDKVADSLDKARDNLEQLKTSAEESDLVKKVKEPIERLLGSEDREGAGVGGDAGKEGGGALAGPRAQLAVKSQEVQTAIEKQLQDVQDQLRATSAFKKALALREKIVESDHPLVQRALDMADGVARTTSRLFAENDHAKTIKLLHSLDPAFSPETFKRSMAATFVPRLRLALLRGDPAPIKASMSPKLAEHELESLKEWDAHGYCSHSKLLNLDAVEILSAHTREDGRPTLIIHFVSQENHCIRDRSGAVVEGAPDNIQDVEQTWAMQLNSQGQWEVLEYAVLSSRPSW